MSVQAPPDSPGGSSRERSSGSFQSKLVAEQQPASVAMTVGSWLSVQRLAPETKGSSREQLAEQLEAEGTTSLAERTVL